jgi:hypothetical protein
VTEPINVAIADALFTHLTVPELSGMSAATRAKPFVPFTPTVGTAYLDIRPLLRAEPEHFGLGYDNSDFLRGIFQVDAVVPNNVGGEAPGVRLASLVAGRFPIGTPLSFVCTLGRRKLTITNTPTIAAAVKDAPWVRFPVSIPYLVIT